MKQEFLISSSELIHKTIDIALVLLSCALAYKIRFDEFWIPQEYQLPSILLVLAIHISLNAMGNYSLAPSYVTRNPIPRIFASVFIGIVVTTLFLYLSKSGSSFSRLWFVYSSIGALFLLATSTWLINNLISVSRPITNIVVAGNSATARSIIQFFNRQSGRVRIVHHFFQNELPTPEGAEAELQNMAKFIEKKRTGADGSISEVWIGSDVYNTISTQLISSVLYNTASRLVWIAELPDGITTLGSISRTENFVTINSNLNDKSRLHLLTKSFLDRLFAFTGILVLLPLLILVAVAIKLETNGPIFFRQLRYGLNGSEFKVWKFRTMFVTESENEFSQATRNDPRVTRVGEFLRKTSIDELPQLLNVLTGSMSLVGPRPHPNKLNEEYRTRVDQYMARHVMKPGITGLAQIRGFRGETPQLDMMEGRISLDIEYINTWSLWTDIKILLLTFAMLFKEQKNAF